MPTITIATDYSRTPGPRYAEEGDFSGESFRKEVLVPALRAAAEARHDLEVELDGTAGYGTSFLEEAFGGLIREDGFALDVLKKILKIRSSEEPYLIDDVVTYMEDAERARR